MPRPEPRTRVSGCNAGRTAVREKVEHSVKLKPALNVPKTPEDIGNGKTSALDHSLQCANRFSAGIVHLTFTLRTISDNAVMHEMGERKLENFSPSLAPRDHRALRNRWN